MSKQNEFQSVEIDQEQAALANGTASEDGASDETEAMGGAPLAEAGTEEAGTEEAGTEEDGSALDPIMLQAELEAAQARADEHYEKLQRVTAEFQNARRRQEMQLSDSIARASQRTVVKLLPILDDLELAFQNVPSDLNEQQTAWLDGFSQIQQKLQTLLAGEGVTVIEPTGKFDPDFHEAISSEPTDEVESQHIIATLRKGYKQKGRVLRPALVRVAA